MLDIVINLAGNNQNNHNIQDSNNLLPSTYTLLLVPVDDPDNSMFVETANPNQGLDTMLTLNIKLKSRCLWTYSVFAYGCMQHPITAASELSKPITS